MNEINEIYQDREILGNDLELQNILFVNTDFEHTNLFQSYLKGKKSVLHNPDINDPAFLSWTNIIDLIQYCKNTFSLLKSFDILDINHLYYKQAWRRIFEKIETDCDISNSDMNINYLILVNEE